jgi:hypothetical protein
MSPEKSRQTDFLAAKKEPLRPTREFTFDSSRLINISYRT